MCHRCVFSLFKVNYMFQFSDDKSPAFPEISITQKLPAREHLHFKGREEGYEVLRNIIIQINNFPSVFFLHPENFNFDYIQKKEIKLKRYSKVTIILHIILIFAQH